LAQEGMRLKYEIILIKKTDLQNQTTIFF